MDKDFVIIPQVELRFDDWPKTRKEDLAAADRRQHNEDLTTRASGSGEVVIHLANAILCQSCNCSLYSQVHILEHQQSAWTKDSVEPFSDFV